jgi:hypothetical protein
MSSIQAQRHRLGYRHGSWEEGQVGKSHEIWATEADKQRFSGDVTWNDLSGTPYDEPDRRRMYAERFVQFMLEPSAKGLIEGFSLYVARCLLFPARTAYRRWTISALPGYQWKTYAHLSVGGQWAATCFEQDDEPMFMFYGRCPLLQRRFGGNLEGLTPAYCETANASESKGGDDQIKLLCRPGGVARLLAQDAVVEALRDVSLRLMEDKASFWHHHCFDLADAILLGARQVRAT